MFGPHVLDACARFRTSVDLGEGLCRHDHAEARRRIAGGGIAPNDSKAHRILIGEPCTDCKQRYAEDRAHQAAVQRRGAELIVENQRKDALAASAAKREQARRLDSQARELRAEAGALAASAAPPRRSVRLTGADARRAVAAFEQSRRPAMAASARPVPPVSDPDGSDYTAHALAKVTRLRDAAVARGDQTRVAELNGQISRLGWTR